LEKIRVVDYISPLHVDIDSQARSPAPETDAIVNLCISSVTQALMNRQSRQFTVFQQLQLADVFFSMQHAHRAIRELLRSESDPMGVHVMPIVRVQLETLFAVCLVVENPVSFDLYLKDAWKKLYIRHIVAREECRNLPRVMVDLEKVEVHLENLRPGAGVTDNEKQTIDEEQLGVSLPPGSAAEKITPFPTPRVVIDQMKEPDRKQMLQRLYPEYQYLCGFVHFSPGSRMLSAVLEKREFPGRPRKTQAERLEIFQTELAIPALGLDLISVAQSCCEFALSEYPEDIELVKAITGAWKHIEKNWLLGKAIWQLRVRRLLEDHGLRRAASAH
jgi:hypothetical protein